MKNFVALVLFGAFVIVSPAMAEKPKGIADSFFTTYIGGSGGKAIDGFFASNPLILQKTQQLQLLKSQLTTIETIYGAPFGYELVSKEELSPSLERRVYITKHKYHPVTWEMYFYKPGDSWMSDQLIFVDQYQLIGSKK